MPYTVKDGVNGFVAKNKDASDMATKIQLLMGNAPLRKKLQEGIENSVMHLKTQEDFENGIELFFCNAISL
jgi:glycosyltransferase involved in cell wall biosynthesis